MTLNKQIAEIRIKRSILVNRWSPAKGCALGKDRVAKELNSYLEAIRLKIHQIHRELVLDMSAPVTANAIMNRYCGNDVKMLLEVFEDHNDKCRALIGKEYVEGTVRKFDTTLLYLKQFLKQRYRKDDIPLPEINQEFVRDFEFFLKTEKSCQNNSALKHIKNFRKVIRIAIGNDWIKRDPFFGLRFKAEEVNVDFLSNDELKRIRQKKITIPRLERIRDIFVFCCFTGLAFVDVSQLTAEDLIKDAQCPPLDMNERRASSFAVSTPGMLSVSGMVLLVLYPFNMLSSCPDCSSISLDMPNLPSSSQLIMFSL